MNIKHATTESITGDRLKAIFDRQRELMEKYHHIEERSGLCQTSDVPIDLDDRRGQARIKDFAWRVTEELAEACDAQAEENILHVKEELVDGLHFLTELTILAGKDYNSILAKDIPMSEDMDYLDLIFDCTIEHHPGYTSQMQSYDVANFIQSFGMMCNCLKNKPWKQSHMLTDRNEFQVRLSDAWCHYFLILKSMFKDADELADTYLKKSQVNKFRQRSKY